MDGFFNVNKAKGFTSFDLCNKIKHQFHEKKVGHTGTLDPNATGVMQIALGKATKLLPLLEDHIKVYEPTVMFGIETPTLDPEGEITKEEKFDTTEESIDEALATLKNMKEQVPPIYSAIKVNGKKLYQYAREGKEVQIDARLIEIFEAQRSSDIFYVDGRCCCKLRLKVSKGFYVRSFVRDLAYKLGTIAIMSDLVRLQTGDFKLEDSKLITELSENDLISIEDLFKNYPRFDCKEYLVKLIKNGIELDERQIVIDKPFTVYFDNKILAIYQPASNGKYKIVQYLGE